MEKKSDAKLLINIFGLPGVGKSTLRNALVEYFGKENSGKIPGDHYLKSKPMNVSFLEYFTRDNYDWGFIEKIMSRPLGEVVSPPLFDFEKFVRVSDNGYHKKYKINRLNFMDTTYPCHFADLRILIDLDPEERKKRVTERGRTDYFWKTFVLGNWDETEAKDRAKDKIHRTKADLVLDGRRSVEYNMKKAIELINDL